MKNSTILYDPTTNKLLNFKQTSFNYYNQIVITEEEDNHYRNKAVAINCFGELLTKSDFQAFFA